MLSSTQTRALTTARCPLASVTVMGTSALPAAGADSYHGFVIDMDTRAPLAGAVVAVYWMRKPIISMDGPQFFHRAVEALTDSAGRFSVDSRPGIDWNPFTYVMREPTYVIFKPGYGAFPSFRSLTRVRREAVKEQGETFRAGQSVVIELPRLTTPEEMRESASPEGYIFSDIQVHLPQYMRFINIQRGMVGLQPLAVE